MAVSKSMAMKSRPSIMGYILYNRRFNAPTELLMTKFRGRVVFFLCFTACKCNDLRRAEQAMSRESSFLTSSLLPCQKTISNLGGALTKSRGLVAQLRLPY